MTISRKTIGLGEDSTATITVSNREEFDTSEVELNFYVSKEGDAKGGTQ